MNDLASIITAIALLVTAIGTYLNSRVIKKIDREVTTMNSQTISEIVDADETRRIIKIPKLKRSPVENAHVKASKEK